MKTLDITIVICTYNRAELLRRALETAVQQETDGKFTYEIVVIDDGSTDGTRNVVMEVAIRSRVLIRYLYQETGGIASARNRGVAAARGNWIAFLDDDELAESDWLKSLLDVGLKMDADCVAGTIRLHLSQDKLAHLGPVCRSMLGENMYPPKPAILRGKALPPTGNILIARKVFQAVGPFDTSMLSGGSDTDIALRFRTVGFVTWTAPDAVVRHLVPPFRLKYNNFKRTSIRWGIQFSFIHWKRFGRRKMTLFSIQRIGQALLIKIPRLMFACLKDDKAGIVEQKCLLWRTVGYTRQTLRILAPNLFPQEGFFAQMDFRKARKDLPDITEKVDA